MKIPALAALATIGYATELSQAEKTEFTSQLLYSSLGFKGVDPKTVACVVDVNNSVYALENAIYSFEQSTFDDLADGVTHIGEILSNVGHAMKDCADEPQPTDSTLLMKEGGIMARHQNMEYSPMEQILKVNGVNVFEPISQAVLAFQAQNYAETGL